MGQTLGLAVFFLLIIVACGSERLPSHSDVLTAEGSIPRVLIEAQNINSTAGGASKSEKVDAEAKNDLPPASDPSKQKGDGDSSRPKVNPEIEKSGNNSTENSTRSAPGIGPEDDITKTGTVDSGKAGDHKSSEESGKDVSKHEQGRKEDRNVPNKNKGDDLSPPPPDKQDDAGAPLKNKDNSSLPKAKDDHVVPVKRNDDSGASDKKRNPTTLDPMDKGKTKDPRHAEGCDEVHSCTDKNKMTACLRASGNERQELSLLIQNKGENVLYVNITVPPFFKADPLNLTLEKQQSKTVQVYMVNHEVARSSDLSKIVVNAGHGNCTLEVPNQSIHFLYKQSFFEGFSHSAIITPMFGVYLLLFTVLAIGGTWMCCKFRGKRKHGDGVRYQELEMNLPESNLPISVGGKLEAETTDGWDEVWDDNWEDTESARPSSRPIQSLSSKGLAARRSNKDGWDNGWDD